MAVHQEVEEIIINSLYPGGLAIDPFKTAEAIAKIINKPSFIGPQELKNVSILIDHDEEFLLKGVEVHSDGRITSVMMEVNE